MFKAGTWLKGGPLYHQPSPHILQDWFLAGDAPGGSYRLRPSLNMFTDDPGDPKRLSKFEHTAAAVDSVGGRLLIQLYGMPRDLSAYPDTAENYQEHYWKYPPEDSGRYRALVYNFMKYFSVPGEFVTDNLLFPDTTGVATLGIPGVNYELWNEHNFLVTWMPFTNGEDSEQCYFDLYRDTHAALDSLLADFGDKTDIAGLGFTLRRAGGQYCPEWSQDVEAHLHRLCDFIAGHGLGISQLSSWCYGPGLPLPGNSVNWGQDYRDIIESHGFTDFEIHAGEWSPGFSDTTLYKGDEDPRITYGHMNSTNEVGAAFVPMRMQNLMEVGLFDVQSYFEMVEGNPSQSSNFVPLFRAPQTAVYTHCGLRKAITNVFTMVGMLETHAIALDTTVVELPPTGNPHDYSVYAYPTADPGESVSVLLWHYFDYKTIGNPAEYNDVQAAVDDGTIHRAHIELNIGDLAEITEDARYLTIEHYLMDRTHSNAWRYREAIFQEIMTSGEPDTMALIWNEEENGINYRSFENGDDMSVALECVQRDTVYFTDTVNLDLELAPFAVSLVRVTGHHDMEDVQDGDQDTPGLPRLQTNFPNPFNPCTSIAFTSDFTQRIRIGVYDLAGRPVALLADEEYPAGRHTVVWDGRNAKGRLAASGAYLVRLESGGTSDSRKLLLVR